jgi:hypothetical protein
MNKNRKLSTPGLRLKAFLEDLAILSYRYGVIIATTYRNGIWVLPAGTALQNVSYQAPLGQVREWEAPSVFVTINSQIPVPISSNESIQESIDFSTLEAALAAASGAGGLWIEGNRFSLVPEQSIAALRKRGALVLRLESGIIQLEPVQAVAVRR